MLPPYFLGGEEEADMKEEMINRNDGSTMKISRIESWYETFNHLETHNNIPCMK